MESKRRLLIVEDDDPLRRALLQKLSSEGYEVLEAKNGEEGLNIALGHHPHLILLDLAMPRMDGLTMLKLLREDKWGEHVPVIILTNLSSGEEVSEALHQGAYDFLLKTDWSLEDVVARIKQRLKVK